MATPGTGRFGKLKAPLNDGVAFSNVALTPVASKTIGGKTYTNRFVEYTANNYWNKNPEKKASWRLQGIIGEATIVPGAANDKVATPAAISYYKDNGAIATAAINSAIAVTRPVAGDAIWVAIVITMATGVLTAVSGKTITGTRTALLNTFGDPSSGAAGSMPLVAVDELIVGMLKVDSDGAALFAGSDITYVDGNGRLLQERSDLPGGRENLLEGGVLFEEALLPCHTGAIGRKAFASGYCQKTALADVADLINWKVSVTRGVVSMPGKGDTAPAKEIAGSEDVSGSASFYQTGRGKFDLFRKGAGYIMLYPDSRDTTEYYEGTAIWSSIDENNDDAAKVNNLNFGIDGYLERRGTS